MTALRPCLVADSALTATQRAALAALLVAAFPQHAAMFRDTAWASAEPEYRLWLKMPAGDIPYLGVAYRLFRSARYISGGARDFATNIILCDILQLCCRSPCPRTRGALS